MLNILIETQGSTIIMVRLLVLYAHHRMDVVVLGLQDPMHENDVLDIAIIKNLSCN